MKKVLKWIAIGLGAVVVLLIVVAAGLSIAGAAQLNRTHQVEVKPITIPTCEPALARGEHLVNVACKSCHGQELTGQPMLNDPAIGAVYASNITGLGQTHSEADLVRAIRHGVDTDGRQLIIMPADAFIYFSEEDLGAVV